MAPCERNEQISDERKHVGYEHNVKAESRQTCTDMYALGGNLIRDGYGLPRITRLHHGCSPRATPGATIRELLPKATPGATSRELPDYSRELFPVQQAGSYYSRELLPHLRAIKAWFLHQSRSMRSNA